MHRKNSLIGLKNQLKRFRLPLLIFLLFWIGGIVTLAFIEQGESFGHLILVSIGVREGISDSDFIGFYQLLWPIMFELLILGFLLSVLLDFYSYNPVGYARKIAKQKKDHTVVLGYNHLGERIVNFLRENKKSYVAVEIQRESIDDLIYLGEPVVVGDYTDEDILKAAGIHRCKEVFCVTTKLRRALIVAGKIRKLNPECRLYMRVFDDHFRKYLSEEPYKAFTFSISNWSMESIKEWSNDNEGKVLVLGNDTVVQRIITHFGEKRDNELYVIDPEVEPEVYSEYSNVKIITEQARFLETIEEHCNMQEITQVFICWNKEEIFSDAIILTMALKREYPHIGIYVRIYDEELAVIARSIGATTFSSSGYAFRKLQKEVEPDSSIAVPSIV